MLFPHLSLEPHILQSTSSFKSFKLRNKCDKVLAEGPYSGSMLGFPCDLTKVRIQSSANLRSFLFNFGGAHDPETKDNTIRSEFSTSSDVL